MRISPPLLLGVQVRRRSPRGELVLRYGAAYGCTLVTVAAAQLHISTQLALALAAITLLGLPLSLYLRFSGLRIGRRRVPRVVINSLVVVASGAACFSLLFFTQPDLFSRGLYHALLLSHTAGDSIGVLMSMFLIFATFRHLAIINDKDAVLSAVPSFSVLLLLIVVNRGPAVVLYFLLWSLFAAVLFALDHRLEAREGLHGFVPAAVPGEDVRLAARGLATVMSTSLLCAVVLSYYLSSRHPEERGQMESWILGLAGRLTQLALNMPEVSVNSGPERQIDFSSAPALPSRAPLWNVAAFSADGQPLQPTYWRMFTFAHYNGATWSQTSGAGSSIPLQVLNSRSWPRLSRPANGEHRTSSRTSPHWSPPTRSGQQRSGEQKNLRRRGFDILGQHPFGKRLRNAFGHPRRLVYQALEPLVANVGFVPALPAARLFRVRSEEPPKSIRVRSDGAIDAGVLSAGSLALVLSEVSPGPAYGVSAHHTNRSESSPPSRRIPLVSSSAQLTAAERAQNLTLPVGLRTASSRVLALTRRVLRDAAPDESNFRRAQRLAWAVQEGAVYTLRPPAIPQGRDAADFFLFESRRGYCTYFGGALTVLCRAASIPARVASGFANPEWSSRGGGVLREANAHAWTEVWVEGWGWAVVDATPSADRGDNAPGWWENWQDLFTASYDAARRWGFSHRSLLFLGALLIMCVTLAFAWRNGLADGLISHLQRLSQGRVRLSQDQSRRVVLKSYQRVARKLARRFRRRSPSETPDEWLDAAQNALAFENPQPLRELTRLYQQAEYSPRALEGKEGAAALQAMQSISWRARK